MEEINDNYFSIMYGKDGSPENIKIPSRIVNHRISLFTPEYSGKCAFLDKYANSLPNEMFLQMIYIFVKKKNFYPSTKVMKEALEKSKENKEIENKFDWLYQEISNHFNWGKTEKDLYKGHYFNLFKDKNKLRYFFRYLGVQENVYKKYGLSK